MIERDDVWAAREAMWPNMSHEARQAYVAGVSHAFGDVFDIFSDAFDSSPGGPVDFSRALERTNERFEQYLADFTVKGVL